MALNTEIKIKRIYCDRLGSGYDIGKLVCFVEISNSGIMRKFSSVLKNLEQFERFFPLMVTRMIRVGEKSGNLEETLLYLANFYEVEVDNTTKALSTAIEPILLIVIGLVVAFLALLKEI